MVFLFDLIIWYEAKGLSKIASLTLNLDLGLISIIEKINENSRLSFVSQGFSHIYIADTTNSTIIDSCITSWGTHINDSI